MSARVILQECWCPTSKKARGARQLIDLAQPLSDSGQHLAVLSFFTCYNAVCASPFSRKEVCMWMGTSGLFHSCSGTGFLLCVGDAVV